MKPIHRISLSVFADFFQFYVWDPALSEENPSTDWTKDDMANRAKVEEGVVVVSPLRNTDVNVEISFWAEEPVIHYAEWQHVVVCPLHVSSGTVQIHECCGGDLAEISVAPGHYTVRCLFNGLGSISKDGLEGDDFYAIQVWPGQLPSVKLFKAWTEDPTL